MADPDHSPSAAPWREPVRGGHPPAEAVALTGRAQLEAALSEDGADAPLNHLTGMRLTEIGDGTASLRLPLSPWLGGLTGAVELGPLVIPADAAMACAIMTRVPAFCSFTSTEVALRLLRPPTGGAVTARARVLSLGSRLAVAEATVYDDDGPVALAGSSCLMLRVADPAAVPPPPVYPSATGPDPWQRGLPSGFRAGPVSREQLQAISAGALPGPPLHHLFGIEAERLGDGRAELTMPASPWFCAPPPGRLQGGTIAVLAEAGQSAALIATLPPGSRPAAAEVKLNYVRALAADDGTARCETRVVHAGRRTAMTVGEVTDARGRTVAVCTGSALVERVR